MGCVFVLAGPSPELRVHVRLISPRFSESIPEFVTFVANTMTFTFHQINTHRVLNNIIWYKDKKLQIKYLLDELHSFS